MKKIDTSAIVDEIMHLKTGKRVLLSGALYTARDAAHQRILEQMKRGENPPFPIKNATIYYAGPTPTPEGKIIGSCGPTTSGRMDVYTPFLLDAGLKCMIGKGKRNDQVIEAIKRNRAVYLCAIGGAGALAARCVQEVKVLAYEDLGCESVKRLVLKDFPLIVAIDASGNNIFA